MSTVQSTASPPAAASLDALRNRLDEIDLALLDTLRARLACCVEIAQVKRRADIPMMQPERIGVVQERAARFGREHGIDLEFLRGLYHTIIDETCRLEDLVIGADDEPREVPTREGQQPCAPC